MMELLSPLPNADLAHKDKFNLTCLDLAFHRKQSNVVKWLTARSVPCKIHDEVCNYYTTNLRNYVCKSHAVYCSQHPSNCAMLPSLGPLIDFGSSSVVEFKQLAPTATTSLCATWLLLKIIYESLAFWKRFLKRPVLTVRTVTERHH